MVKSPIKIIDSGTAPTTANLGEGQIAFGTVDGATKLYGSDGTTVSELGGGSGQGPQGPAGEDGITPTIGDNGNWFLGETDTGKPSRGEQGPKGEQGDPGAKGDPGPQGEPGQDGAPGAAGTPGTAATITVGETTTGEAGTQASVTNSGTTSAAVLNFTIPKGAKGDKGDTGDTGPAGATTFAGLTDQPTDNAALKTALDAKANQATVDSLTATVNGKVSSVSAGKGISVTGTATAPVVNGMIAVPDYENAQTINFTVTPPPFNVPSNGVIYNARGDNASRVDTGTLTLSIVPSGKSDSVTIADCNYKGGSNPTNYVPGAYPVSVGDKVSVVDDNGANTFATFAPYKFVEIS